MPENTITYTMVEMHEPATATALRILRQMYDFDIMLRADKKMRIDKVTISHKGVIYTPVEIVEGERYDTPFIKCELSRQCAEDKEAARDLPLFYMHLQDAHPIEYGYLLKIINREEIPDTVPALSKKARKRKAQPAPVAQEPEAVERTDEATLRQWADDCERHLKEVCDAFAIDNDVPATEETIGTYKKRAIRWIDNLNELRQSSHATASPALLEYFADVHSRMLRLFLSKFPSTPIV